VSYRPTVGEHPEIDVPVGHNGQVRVIVDLLKCESNGLCVVQAPDVFEIDDADELVVLNATPPEDRRAAVEAAVRMCPKQALSLAD
jgi:ferredoxin